MNNLFVINTPFQLLSAFMVANSYEKEARNFLLVLRPNEYENWQYSTGIQYMLNDKSTWKSIFIVQKWLQRDDKISSYRQQIKDMSECIESAGGINQVFLGSDKIIQNQLIVEIAGCTTYCLLDEGIGSYDSIDRRKLSKMWQFIRIKYLRFVGNIKGNMKYNLHGIGYGPGNVMDYLYRPELLDRKSNGAKAIEKSQIQPILENITSHMQEISLLAEESCMIFLGSPFIEHSTFSINTEMQALHNIYQIAQQSQLRLIYKTHHSENQDKLNTYQQACPGMYILRSLEPVELLYHKYNNIKYVISCVSSGMLYINTFADQYIKPIATYKLYGQAAIQPRIEKIFDSSGIFTPINWREMEDFFRG